VLGDDNTVSPYYQLYSPIQQRAQDYAKAKALLSASRAEEQRMAAWIDRRIENVTAAYLEHIDQLKHVATALG